MRGNLKIFFSSNKYNYFQKFILLINLFFFILLVVGSVSEQPLSSLFNLFVVPFTKEKYIWHILERSIPLVFTGLAYCVILKVNEFNLSVEGVFFFSALISSLIGVYFSAPKMLHPFFALFFAALAGAFVMLFVAFMKLKFHMSTMVVSIMMNYVLLNVGMHILTNLFRDKSFPYTATYPIRETAKLSLINYNTSYALLFGWVLAIILAVIVYKTNFGYKIRLLGTNVKFAEFWGINVNVVILVCQVIGGVLAGIGGCVEVLGCYERFRWTQLPGYGWTGMTIAIMCGNNPLFVPVVAILFAYLEVGCEFMLINTNIQPEIFDIIKFFILALFSSKFIIKRQSKK